LGLQLVASTAADRASSATAACFVFMDMRWVEDSGFISRHRCGA
jgi:hypothetical protein